MAIIPETFPSNLPRALRAAGIAGLASIALSSTPAHAADTDVLVNMDICALAAQDTCPNSTNGPAGGDVEYIVRAIWNSGANPGAVQLSDKLPIGAVFHSIAAPAGVSCSTSLTPGDTITTDNQTVICALNAFAGAGNDNAQEIHFRVTLPSESTNWRNEASVTSENNDVNTSNDTLARAFTTYAAADLRLSVATTPSSSASEPLQPGTPYTQTVTVENAGPNPIPAAGRVVVGFTVPEGAAVTQAGGSNGWTCSPSIASNAALPAGSQVQCTRTGAFAAGTSSALVIHGTPNVGGSITTGFSVQGYRTAGTDPDARMPDGQPDNNAATDTLHVSANPAADLAIGKALSSGYDTTQPVGEEVEFTLTPRFLGGQLPAGSVINVTDTAAGSGLTLLEASGDGWACAVPGGVVNCSRTLAADQANFSTLPVIKVRARVDAKGSQSNTAKIAATLDDQPLPDPAPTNNSSPASVTGTSDTDLRLTKTSSNITSGLGPAVQIGEEYTYSLQVRNLGPLDVPATNGTDDAHPAIEIVETIPPGVTITAFSGSGWSCSNTLPMEGDGVSGNLRCTYAAGLNKNTTAPTLTLTAVRTTTGFAENRACVTLAPPALLPPSREETNPANNCAGVAVGASANDPDDPVAADLSLTKTVNKTSVFAGEELTYTLTVTNHSATHAAHDVKLTDTLTNLVRGTTYGNALVRIEGLQPGQSCTPNAPASTANGSLTVLCNLGTLAAGAQQAIGITVRPTTDKDSGRGNTAFVASESTYDPNLANNSASLGSDSTLVLARVDLVASKEVATAHTTGTAVTAPTASLMQYTVRARNNGPSSAENVWLRDVLPDDAVLTTEPTATDSGGTCRVLTAPTSAGAPTDGGTLQPTGAPGGVIECVWGTAASPAYLPSGTQREVKYELRSLSGLPADTRLDNTVDIGTVTNEPNLSNNRAAAQVMLTDAELDLQVEITHDADAIPLGGEVTYTVRVSNSGPSYATQVVVEDRFPSLSEAGAASSATFAYLAGQLTHNGGNDVICEEPADGATDGSVRCTFPQLAPGETRQFSFRLRAENLPPSAISGTIFHKVTVTPQETEYRQNGDDVLVNNVRYDQTSTNRVAENADLALLKTAAPGMDAAATRGQPFSYLLTVTNNGPASSYSAIVRDTLPTGVAFQSASDPACSYSAGIVDCSVGPLTMGESKTFTVTVLVPEAYAGPDPIVNTAQVHADGDPNPDNDGSSITTPVQGEPYPSPVRVLKSVYAGHDGGQQCPGEKQLLVVDKNRAPKAVTWCFGLTNTGATTLVNPVWDDSLLFTDKPGTDQTPITLRAGSPAILQPGETAWYYVEEFRDSSLVNEVHVTLTPADETGTPTGAPAVTGSDNAGTIFAYLFDPPFGVKTGEQVGTQNIVRWTMMWVNDNPVAANDVWISDPLPAGMTLHGNVSCTAHGDTVVLSCGFEPPGAQYPRGRVRVNANFGADMGKNIETAEHALEIVFDVLVNNYTQAGTYENQGSAEWTPPDSPDDTPLTTVTIDPGAATITPDAPPPPSSVNYDPARVTDVITPQGGITGVPANKPWALLLLTLAMLGWAARHTHRR